MKTRNEDALVARLLSGRDSLSVCEKDQMLAALLSSAAGTTAQQRKMSWYHWAMAAACLVLAVPMVNLLWSGNDAETLTAKGGGEVFAAFSASCPAHSPPQRCQPGDKLVFSVENPPDKPFFAAFATRSDGVVLWYYPQSEDGISVNTQTDADKVIDSAVVLGNEHPVGSYRVRGVFSAEPLTRAQIRERFEQQLTENLLVVERNVEIVQP